MLSIGDSVYIRGEVVGIEKDEEGNYTFRVELPDQRYGDKTGKERITIYEGNSELFMSK